MNERNIKPMPKPRRTAVHDDWCWGVPSSSKTPGVRLLPKRRKPLRPQSKATMAAAGSALKPPASSTKQQPQSPAAQRLAAADDEPPPVRPAVIAPTPPPSNGRELHDELLAWLAKRKLPTPHSIIGLVVRAEVAAHAAALCEALGSAQPELRERERRALVRFAEQRAAAAAAPPPPSSERNDSSSDDEGSRGEDGYPLPAVQGGTWPQGLTFSTEYRWASSVPAELQKRYMRPDAPARSLRPSRRVAIVEIREPSHPAFGECGLFARRDLVMGQWILDYTGVVTASGSEDKTSDYVSDFGEQSELALDAKTVGNEARFVNDYRNTGRRPNVEFRIRRDRHGCLRQGVYVCAKGGVSAGEELLINYGKPFWRARVAGSLEAFVKVRPR